MRVVTCAGGAPWEAPLVRGLQRRELGIEVVRRCVDHGELLGIALRDRPRAVVLAAELPWLDRELVGTLQDAGVAVVAVESTPGARRLGRVGITHCLAATASADDLAVLLHQLDGPGPDDPGARGTVAEPRSGRARASGGELLVVWGGPGAPGRTSVGVQLALQAARSGRTTRLADGDAWAPAVVQLLGLPATPAITNAVHAASNGWPEPLASSLLAGPNGLQVLGGLPRADLWPEVRERAWRDVLDACREDCDLVVVDVAAPIEEDEELSFDRVPFRRNLMTRVALAEADRVLMVAAADPIGLRHAIFAYRSLQDALPTVAERTRVILNRTPASPRRLQDCSRAIEEWTGHPPIAFLPRDEAFVRVVWEGRPLADIAPRSRWLRELRMLSEV